MSWFSAAKTDSHVTESRSRLSTGVSNDKAERADDSFSVSMIRLRLDSDRLTISTIHKASSLLNAAHQQPFQADAHVQSQKHPCYSCISHVPSIRASIIAHIVLCTQDLVEAISTTAAVQHMALKPNTHRRLNTHDCNALSGHRLHRPTQWQEASGKAAAAHLVRVSLTMRETMPLESCL